MRSLIALCTLSIISCAAPVHRPERIVDPQPLVTAGARCQNGHCACRNVDAYGNTIADGDNGEGAIADGMKRFELRTGRVTDEIELTIEGRGMMKKPTEQIEASCGYIDLAPGPHRVHLSVKSGPGEGGASPKLLIYEYGKNTQSWYTTFGITCGETGPCTDSDLEERMANLAKARGLFDRCGSTKVHDLRWDAHKGADQRVTSVDVDFTLDIYKFDPRFPHGGTCKGPSPE